MTPTAECVHCGRELDVDEQTLEGAEEHAGGDVSCSACEGMHEQPVGLSECESGECEEPAPFTIVTKNGEIRRCRNCLVRDLEKDWHRFYSESRVINL